MSKARDIASAAPAPSTVSATELGYVDGVTSAIQTQLDAKTAKSTLTNTGDIYYASAANTPDRLGIGSTGNVLTVASGIPSWAAPAGGGKVLQVIYGNTTTNAQNSTSTYADTNLTASITPSSATSKVLAIVQQNGCGKETNNTYFFMRLLRGATEIVEFGASAGSNNTTTNNYIGTIGVAYLDSPATTSSTTYKTQFQSASNNAKVSVQQNSATSTIILMEIGA